MTNDLLLHEGQLRHIADRIAIPKYDRKSLKKGIVHIGVGAFHRAHQAYYMHLLHEKGAAADWGICGVGIRKNDLKIQKILHKQDHLYTLIIRHPNGNIENQIIGGIVDFIVGLDHPNSVIDRLAKPETRIVSLTITEGGYNYDTATGEFNFSNPAVMYDLEHPNEPKTVFGYLTAALNKRRESGVAAFTVMSCDNIEHNGSMMRKMLLSFAERQDQALAEWIAKEVSFPNTMVDRITPVTTKDDVDYLREEHGVLDAWPVTCEPFIQWVIEDKFSNGRPNFELVGAQFVTDVAPYEKMKLRLLNAGHSVIGILGALQGYETIDACMGDQTFAAFMRAFMDIEASPVLDAVPGIDLTAYKDSLEIRFSNPNLKDAVSRICSESSAKLPKFLIPTLQENLASGGSIEYATLVLAAWCYYSDKAIDKNGKTIVRIDSLSDELNHAAKNTTGNTLAFVQKKSIFGTLINNPRFVSLYSKFVTKIYADSNVKNHMKEIMNM